MRLFRSGSKAEEPSFKFAAAGETEKRAREIQLLINLIEPDPKLQPWFVSDDASALDICSLEPQEIRQRLEAHFRARIPADLSTPMWRLVATLKSEFPGWPDEPPWDKV
jgi:hypothetical protein